MKIQSITLHLYNRLSLNNIEHIHVDFNADLQLILGTNCSGKSSILRELTPLPSDIKDFKEGGYKFIEIKQGNDHYVLKSLFENGAKYSFVKNGVELNPLNKITVQRDLVFNEFKIDVTLHKLLTGDLKFHSMTSATRRYWFTRISSTDYTFVLNKYNELKDKLRENSYLSKHLNGTLTKLLVERMSTEDIIHIKQELSELNHLLTELLEHKEPIRDTLDNLNQQESRLIDKIKLHYKKTIKNVSLINRHDYSDIEEIKSLITLNKYKLGELELSLSELNEALLYQTELHNKIMMIDSYGDYGSLETIEKQIKETESNIHSLQTRKVFSIDLSNYDINRVKDAINSCLLTSDIVPIVGELPVFNENLTREHYEFLYGQQNILENTIVQHKKTLEELRIDKIQYEHLKIHNKTECPKCKHHWIRDYNEVKHNRLLSLLEIKNKELQEVESLFSSNKEEIQNIDSYYKLIRGYREITKLYNILNPLWDLIIADNVIKTNPSRVLDLLKQFDDYLSVLLEEDLYKKSLAELTTVKELILSTKENDKLKTEQVIEEISNKIHDTVSEIKRINNEIKNLNSDLSIIQELESIKKEVANAGDAVSTLVNQKYKILEQTYLNKCIEFIKSELSERETKLTNIELFNKQIKEIENQLEKLKEEEDILKLIIKELCPKEGLIATSLILFINNVLRRMNGIINSIWSYPVYLQVQDISEETNVDLDYKFSIMINNGSKPIDDITEGSTSLKEVVDLAFVLTCKHYLGLNHLPIMLDEFGSSMDYQHRKASYNIINNLLRFRDVEQIFVISHFEENYGDLQNLEIMVLSEANIILPKDTPYNQHVTIQYS